jgi:hypothetical protein
VYLQNAEVYEPVFCVNRLFTPGLVLGVIALKSVNVDCIANVFDTTKLDPLLA